MSAFISEFIGVAILIILGDGVVANVVLNKTKGHNGGWIVITFGWAMAVFIAVNVSLALGGKAHLNPAATIALAAFGKLESAYVLPFLLGQFLGAFTGAIVVWFSYKIHFDETDDKDGILAVFCTAPAIRKPIYNLVTEIIATYILILGALLFSKNDGNIGALAALPVALLVLGIGLSLGGPTGYAINPARDLGPRIAHYLLPIKNKGGSDWKYSWIPIAGPIVGAILAVWCFRLLGV